MDLDQLRDEIQQDRFELQRTMREGFDRIYDRLSETHDRVIDAEVRIDNLESTQKVIKRTAVGAASAIFSAGLAYLSTWFR